MSSSFSTSTCSLYPLARVTRGDLASISKALWEWLPCSGWIRGETCQSTGGDCPCKRAERVEPFFNFYKNVTSQYIPEVAGNSHAALQSHEHLRDIIVLIQNNPETPRMQLTSEYFSTRKATTGQIPPATDQNRAFNLAVRVLTMVQSRALTQPDGLLETGTLPLIWHDEKSFSEFTSSAFPRREHPALDPSGDSRRSAKARLASIMAKRLQKVAKLHIVPTDELSNHLYLDEGAGTVAIFHYTSVLKESLVPKASGDTGPGKMAPIPSELAIETLSTIKDVLFPDDQTSQSLLRTLVSKKGFDPDITQIFNLPVQLPDDSSRYQYWGSRLLDLHDELENPAPRGLFEKWFERKSGARYVMMATFIGVAFAVILGILGLGVSAFQAWIGWQQWQHPVSEG